MRKTTIAVSITAALAAQAALTADAANSNHRQAFTNKHSTAHFRQPLGSSVLYYHTMSSYGAGIVSQNFTSSTSLSDTYNAAVADDFVVTDASGWTVNQVNAAGIYFNGSGPADSFDVNIYPDNGGFPAAAPTCSYSGLGYTEAPAGVFSIPLSSGCSLAQGTYWVAVAAKHEKATLPVASLAGRHSRRGAAPGSVAEFENPLDGLATGCTTWTNIQTCIPAAGTATGLQIIGAVGGGGGGIDLTVGLALDNGDPNQCGSGDLTRCHAGRCGQLLLHRHQQFEHDAQLSEPERRRRSVAIFQNVNQRDCAGRRVTSTTVS